MKKIIPVWQPIGYSTHIISKQISIKYGVVTAHTGTLDPMAKGVIIVLLDDERLKKYEYAKWKKKYEFEVIFGIETDSYDGLGLITNAKKDVVKVTKPQLEKVLRDFKGKYSQTVPPFAAIKIKGKSLHWYSRNKKLNEIKLPKRYGEIYNINLISLKSVSREKFVKNIIERVSVIPGDLRQEDVAARWNKFLGNANGASVRKSQVYQVAKISVETSKGLYVRSLSQDIAKKLVTTGFVYSLTRTQNGKYSKKDCFSTKQLNLKW